MTLLSGIVFTFILAIIVDIWCTVENKGNKVPIWLFKNSSLIIATALIYLFTYLIDLINGHYVWFAFVVGAVYLIAVDGFIGKKALEKIGHIIGFVFISFLIFIYFCYTRYELQTNFHQPCWSPDGKQIAFFMEKDLYRYHLGFPFSLWSPDDIWKKYYLCTMDYDGGNFKVVMGTDKWGLNPHQYLESYSVMWPSVETIVFNQEMDDNFGSKKFYGKSYKISPDGTRLEELWHWNEKSEYKNVYWLTPDEKYLVLAKDTDQGRIYGIYDRRKNKIKKELPYYGKFYGSYKDNSIALNDEHHLMIIDLDTLMAKTIDIRESETFKKPWAIDGYEYTLASRVYSPDRSMYAQAGGVWTVAENKVVSDFYVKPKRSYLFNIFGE